MSLFKRKKERKIKETKKIDKREEKARDSKKKKQARQKKEVSVHSRASLVLNHPLVTEKGTFLGSLNKYVFEVSKEANRTEVKRAIEELYDVDVMKVNIINFQGKERRYGRSLGRTRAWKKAIVTLKQGDTIELFEGV